MSVYKKFGNYVTLHEIERDALRPNVKEEARINWSCIGEQPLEIVEHFYEELDNAIKRAKNFNEARAAEARFRGK